MNYGEERILNTRKLIFYILYRWKLILLCLVLGGIVLGCFKYYRDSTQLKAAEEPAESPETIAERLSDEELQAVANAVTYSEQLQVAKEYMDSSLLMSLDAGKLEITNIQFMVELNTTIDYTQEERREVINNIVSSYSAYTNSGALMQAIYDDLGVDIPVEDIQELISANDVGKEFNTSLFIKIRNAEPILGIEDLIVTAINDYSSTVSKSITPHTIKLVNVYTGVQYDSDLYSKQQNMWNTIYNYNSRITSAINSFSDDQKAYYNNLLGIEEKEDEVVEISKPQINLVYVLLGAVLGACAACFLILIKYMLSSYLISETDYVTMFGLKYLGMIFEAKEEAEEEASFIKKLEYGDDLLKDYGDNLSFIALKIKLACKAADVTKIALISSCFEGVSEEICADLRKRLKKEEIELICLKDVLTDGTALSNLFDIGNCVLIEKTEQSKIADIRNVMELCNENGIQVMGVVDVK